MGNKSVLTKILAIAGSVLVWLPILAPVLFMLPGLLQGRPRPNFDYLMPAEFFPVALLGCALLLWAALRARLHWRPIAWGLGIAVALLVTGQVLAVVTGLASGETEPTGWQWMLVLGSLVVYVLALIMVGISGALLLRDLFRPTPAAA